MEKVISSFSPEELASIGERARILASVAPSLEWRMPYEYILTGVTILKSMIETELKQLAQEDKEM